MKNQIMILTALSVLVLSACAAGGAAAPESLAAAEPASGGFADVEVRSVAAESEAGFAAESADSAAFDSPAQQTERLVIYNANLALVVDDPVDSLERISALATDMGGFVVTSNLYESSYRVGDTYRPTHEANITIRVPAERLDEALDALKGLAVEVDSESISGQDVTQEYTDLASRLRNLETAEAQLTEIMDGARKTEDVLAVYNQLVEVQGQIEVIKGQMQYFEQSARLSSVSIQLIPNVATEPIDVGGWQPFVVAREALEDLVRGLQFAADLLIRGAICFGPILLVVGLPGFFAVRAFVRRRRARKAGSE
ncbi:MAG: DUF4349 domain-containing protein [Anaerolineales bacterium]